MGAWVWRDVIPELAYPAVGFDFPERSSGADSRQRLSFNDYITTLESQACGLRFQRVIFVAHSIAGILAPRLIPAIPGRVAGLAAVGAVLSDDGGSFLSALPLGPGLINRMLLRVFGTRPPATVIRKSLCNDLDPSVADEVIRRFADESRALYTTRSSADMPELPSLYVHLTEDRELDLPLQRRMAGRLHEARTATVQAGHLPMLSRPKELAGVLNAFASNTIIAERGKAK